MEEKKVVLPTQYRNLRDSVAEPSKYLTILKSLTSVPTPERSNKINKEDKVEVAKEDSKTVLVEHVTDKEDTPKRNEEVKTSVDNSRKKNVVTNSTQSSKKTRMENEYYYLWQYLSQKKIEQKISYDKTPLIIHLKIQRLRNYLVPKRKILQQFKRNCLMSNFWHLQRYPQELKDADKHQEIMH